MSFVGSWGAYLGDTGFRVPCKGPFSPCAAEVRVCFALPESDSYLVNGELCQGFRVALYHQH